MKQGVVYKVTTSTGIGPEGHEGSLTRLVRAKNKAQARNHAASVDISVEAVTVEEAMKLAGTYPKLKIERAGEEVA